MNYVIDVIKTYNNYELLSVWLKYSNEISYSQGFFSAELFKMNKEIRDANYDFLSIISLEGNISITAALFEEIYQLNSIERTICHLELNVDGSSSDNKSHVWLVNPFEITQEQTQEVLDMWDKAKSQLLLKKGFINARLFRSDYKNAKYPLINVACWESAELFLSAINNKDYDQHRERSMGYQLHASLCTRVSFLFKN